MSAAIAKRQGGGFGFGRPIAPRVPLTMRRVKLAGSLFVGALMLGVVSNAMLLQPDHPPLRFASSTVAPRPDSERPVQAHDIAAPVHDRAPGPPAPSRVIDPMPVGSIEPPHPAAHDKPHLSAPAAAKPRSRKIDGIAAFLRDGKAH